MRIDRNQLLPALSHAADCAEAKTGDGITAHLLLSVLFDSLAVQATDYCVGGFATAPCDGDAEWAICAPAGRLLALVKALPEGAVVTLTVAPNNRLEVEAGRARYSLACLDAGQFPTVPDAGAGGVALDSAAFRRLLALSAYCVSADDGRPAITGLYLQGDGTTLRATATDGHRLATATTPAPGLTTDAILHRRALGCLRGMLDTTPTIWLGEVGRDIVVRTRSTSLTCRRIEGNFPDWRKVVPAPADDDLRTTFPAEAMLGELARVAPMLGRVDAILRLNWDAFGVTLDGHGEQGHAHAELDAEVAGVRRPTIGLNPTYLRDAVKALGGNVTMTVRDAVFPVVLTSDSSADATGVLMPMRI